MHRLAPTITILFALLAGCVTGTSEELNLAEAPADSLTARPQAQGPAGENGTAPDALHLDGCRGMVLWREWPAGTNPGQAPPGWEPTAGSLVTQTSHYVFSCTRLGLGQYEQATTLVLETHNNLNYRPECTEYTSDAAVTFFRIITGVWTNSSLLNDKIERELSMPVRPGIAEITETLRGSIITTTVTFGLEGASSTLRTLEQFDESPGGRSQEMLLWFHDSGSGALLNSPDVSRSSPGTGIAEGQLVPPNLGATDNFIGSSMLWPSYETTAKIFSFQDYKCTE